MQDETFIAQRNVCVRAEATEAGQRELLQKPFAPQVSAYLRLAMLISSAIP